MYEELMKEYEEAFANEWNEPLSDEARKAVLDFVVWANSERRLTLRGQKRVSAYFERKIDGNQ